MALPETYVSERQYFEDVLVYLKKYRWIYSSPNTHIFSNKVLGQIPIEWLSYLKKVPNHEFERLAFFEFSDLTPTTLQEFCKTAQNLTPFFSRHMERLHVEFPNNVKLKDKKRHEILALAPLIHKIASENDCSAIVDVGSGVGYLSHLLYEEYNYRVLAVEGSAEKVMLAKQYQKRFPGSIDFVQHTEHFVTEDSVETLNQTIQKLPMENYCLVGLHACADLSVTVLKLFLNLEFVKTLVIMPCCYHRLAKTDLDGFKNFPVSTLLKELVNKYEMDHILSIPFLRLACQCITDFANVEDRRKAAENCMFRAILQEVAQVENLQVKRVKRKSGIHNKTTVAGSPFDTYLANLKHTHTINDSEITDSAFLTKMTEKWLDYKGELRLIEALTIFQSSIQHICENIVLLDRVMFLRENGVKCFVVKVTDQRISPRCHALVANKA